jgi:hypothetical protein
MILKSGTVINDDTFHLLWASLRRVLLNDYQAFEIFMDACNSRMSSHSLPEETKAVLTRIKLDPSGLLKEVAREFVVYVDGKFILKDPGHNIINNAESGLLFDFFARSKSGNSEPDSHLTVSPLKP